jgi:dTDP-4-amino-4,6-dideoxygalactose transaminase
LTAEGVSAACTSRTAAVIAVHLFGQPVDMDALGELASVRGIALIEDAAQAHGASWRGRRAGSFGRTGCFSFYPGKNLGAFGDAGAVVTNDPAIACRIRSMANHGRAAGAPECHDLLGKNHRLDALQASILSVKLTRLEAWNAARRRAARWYADALNGLPIEPVRTADGAESSYHLLVVQADRRDELRGRLAAEGIATGIHYPIPCHLQAPFRRAVAPVLPVVEQAAGRILSLPMFPHLTPSQVRRVTEALASALANTARVPALAA